MQGGSRQFADLLRAAHRAQFPPVSSSLGGNELCAVERCASARPTTCRARCSMAATRQCAAWALRTRRRAVAAPVRRSRWRDTASIPTYRSAAVLAAAQAWRVIASRRVPGLRSTLGRNVRLKISKPQLESNEECRNSRANSAISALQNPRVDIYDYGFTRPRVHRMEYFPCGDLRCACSSP